MPVPGKVHVLGSDFCSMLFASEGRLQLAECRRMDQLAERETDRLTDRQS